jgi:hypothetical protein
MATIERLRAKLNQLRILDEHLQLPGANQHRYQLNPPIEEAELAFIEAQHGIILPNDYRQFLLSMGNGGAGPYMLLPLETALARYNRGLLAEPFPYTQWWNGMTPPNWFDLNLSPDEMDQVQQEEGYNEPKHTQGTLHLAHEGYGYYVLLVVSGAERNHLWRDLRAGDAGIGPMPLYTSDQRLTFAEWYETWLNASLHQFGVTSL